MTLSALRRDIAVMMVFQTGIMLAVADIVAFIISWLLSNTIYLGYFCNVYSVAVVAALNAVMLAFSGFITWFSMPSGNISDIIK